MISFKWPEKVPLPEGKGDGDEITSVVKFRLGKDGMVNVTEIDETPVEASDDEPEEKMEETQEQYAPAMDAMLGGPAQ